MADFPENELKILDDARVERQVETRLLVSMQEGFR
jgi:hypothetical protein